MHGSLELPLSFGDEEKSESTRSIVPERTRLLSEKYRKVVMDILLSRQEMREYMKKKDKKKLSCYSRKKVNSV